MVPTVKGQLRTSRRRSGDTTDMTQISRAKGKTMVGRYSFCAVTLLEGKGGTINQCSISNIIYVFVSIATMTRI